MFPESFYLFTQYNSTKRVCIFLMCIYNFQIEIVCVIDLHTKENLNDRVKAFEDVKTACCDLGQSKVVHIQVIVNKKVYNKWKPIKMYL